jgi:hypothetical protein
MDYRHREGKSEGPLLHKEIYKTEHYHGFVIRRLLIAAGVIMLITTPIFIDLLPHPTLSSVIAVVILIILAGILNPRDLNVTISHIGISSIAIVVFEYYAIDRYQDIRTIFDPFFLTNEVLVIIFLFVLYYSTKTLRGMLLKK